MLRAIAIYERDEADGSFKRIKSAQKAGTLFFANHDLEAFERSTLMEMEITNSLIPDKVNTAISGNEFHYSKLISETNHLCVIVSGRELFDVEPYYLLINVNHVDQRGERVKVTLDDILRNPIGYISRDILTHKVREELEDLKVVLLNNITAVLHRGEMLETLEEKSEKLFESSKAFKLKSKELNDSYSKCCYGYVPKPW